MYEKFFGFQRPPFELVPDPDFLYLGESHEAALANLVLGIDSGRGVVAISGQVGTGKTTILRALIRRLGRQQPICYLSQPEVETADLLRAVLDGFGLSSQGLDKIDLRRKIHDFLLARPRAGVLIVDEAHLLSEGALEQIRLLSNLEEDRRKLLQIVLAGQPELKGLLSSPRLRPLAQRVEMFYEIHPLAAAETRAYIERRLRIAGSPGGLRFEPRAVDTIHRFSGGIPRLINVLADRSLITAYVEETQQISERVVQEAFDDLGEVAHAVMPGALTNGHESEPLAASPPSPAEPQARVTPASDTRERPIEDAGGGPARDRWFAVGGISAIVLLALVSLGSRGLPVLPVPRLSQAKGIAPASGPYGESPYAELGTGAANEPTVAADVVPAPERVADLYAVHVASFREMERAREFAANLRRETSEAVRITRTEVETGIWYRVLLGEYESKDATLDRIAVLRERQEATFMRPIRLVHPEQEDRTAETP